MAVANVLDVTQPVVDQSQAGVAQSRRHPAAAVMPNHQDMPDAKRIGRILDHRECVQIRMHHLVGDIAMDEDFARCQADDLVGRHPAVGAAYPQILGGLLFDEAAEVFRILGAPLAGPTAVALEELIDFLLHGFPCPTGFDTSRAAGADLVHNYELYTTNRRSANGTAGQSHEPLFAADAAPTAGWHGHASAWERRQPRTRPSQQAQPVDGRSGPQSVHTPRARN
jgi:hypothetical protein